MHGHEEDAIHKGDENQKHEIDERDHFNAQSSLGLNTDFHGDAP
jgi:hypothetical protein